MTCLTPVASAHAANHQPAVPAVWNDHVKYYYSPDPLSGYQEVLDECNSDGQSGENQGLWITYNCTTPQPAAPDGWEDWLNVYVS
ncbi:MAG: hypothetical protein JO242_21095 [Streptosporangiaceae bacterium]|nr:hypothetical protein [Streptosporangiaceae bacterium]